MWIACESLTLPLLLILALPLPLLLLATMTHVITSVATTTIATIVTGHPFDSLDPRVSNRIELVIQLLLVPVLPLVELPRLLSQQIL